MQKCPIYLVIWILLLTGNTALAANQWSSVQRVFWRTGVVKENTIRFDYPRRDQTIHVNGIPVEPELAISSMIIFQQVGARAMMALELALLEKEVTPVMSALEDHGVQVSALHHHLIRETPRIFFLHATVQGDPVILARVAKAALNRTSTPQASEAPKPISAVDWCGVERVFEGKGKVKSQNVIEFNFERKEKITLDGIPLSSEMGTTTDLEFQMLPDGRVISSEEFVCTAKEVNSVVKTLQENGITVTGIHSHMLTDNPRLFYVHYWAMGSPIQLARILRQALEVTNSKLTPSL